MIDRRARLGLVFVLGAFPACDRLVGGECAPGYDAADHGCVPREAESSSGGQGGSAGQAAVGGSGGECPAPLVACAGACVDLATDAHNCGQCGLECPTAVCVAAVCASAEVGHGVAIGLDYHDVAVGTPAAVLLGNALFMAQAEPVRILEYRAYASPASVARVTAIVADEAAARGRSFSLAAVADAAELATKVEEGGVDVLVFHHQVSQPLGSLPGAPGDFSSALAALFDAGRTAIILMSAKDPAGAQAKLVEDAGLLELDGLLPVGGDLVFNHGWLDVLGQGVLSPLLAPSSAVSFVTSEEPSTSLSFVLQTASGAPVVAHRAFP